MVKKLIAIVALAAVTASCAGKAAQIYVTADSATVSTLAEFKAAKDVRCDAGVIPASSCQAVAKAFVPVWDAYLATNALVTAKAPLLEVDKAVVAYKDAAVNLRNVVQDIKGDARQILLDLLEKAIRTFDKK